MTWYISRQVSRNYLLCKYKIISHDHIEHMKQRRITQCTATRKKNRQSIFLIDSLYMDARNQGENFSQ